ncbi:MULTISPECIES: helix-turn-helix domain-containing protein [unclassified Sphingomonas]|nr:MULTISPECIES: helix-turn-helix domain-containing protein [unclassified Sphingomonas]
MIKANGEQRDTDSVELKIGEEFVAINGHQIHLTRTERAILDRLAGGVDRRIRTADLAKHLGIDVEDSSIQTTKSHVSNLRKKLRGLPLPRLNIVFERRSLTYRLAVEVDRSSL